MKLVLADLLDEVVSAGVGNETRCVSSWVGDYRLPGLVGNGCIGRFLRVVSRLDLFVDWADGFLDFSVFLRMSKGRDLSLVGGCVLPSLLVDVVVGSPGERLGGGLVRSCLLYTSDAADE